MTLKYFNVKNGLVTGNITLDASNSNATANYFIGNISVTSKANLGANANVTITGGTSGQLLATDGAGNLYWAAPAGGGGIGGSNTQVQFNDSGTYGGSSNFTFDKTSGLVTASHFSGEAGNLSNIVGANVTGAVAYATTANSVAGANVTGQVGNALVAGTVYTAAQPNITSVGTLTSLDVSGGLTVGGNLTVNGTLTSINSTIVEIDDLAIVLANDASTSSQANGAGIIINGASANMLYISSTNSFTFSHKISADGGLLSNITGANVTGAVSYATTANSVAGSNVSGQVGYAAVANSVAVANVSGIGNIATINKDGNASNVLYGNGVFSSLPTMYSNANVATFLASFGSNTVNTTGNITAAYFIGNGSQLTGVAKATVADSVANGTSNINIPVASGNATISVSGNANVAVITGTGINVAGYLTTTGNVTASYLIGNGSQLTGVAKATVADSVANGTSNVNIPTASGNATISVSGNANIAVFTGTGANISGYLTVTGNITGGNANLGNLATANFFSGNGSSLSSITGANVTGAVSYATTANSVAGANVSGAVSYATTANSVAGANVSGQVGNALVAGTVYTNAQPNITSVGTLTSLDVTGNITSGNANLGNLVTANFFSGSGNNLSNIQGANVSGAVSYATTANSVAGANVTGAVSYATTANSVAGANVSGQVGNALVAGTVYTAAQPNITSVGTLTSLTVSGTSTLGAVGNVKITGGTTGQYLQTDGSGNLSWSTVSASGGVSGSNTQVIYNDAGSYAGDATFTYDKTTTTLTANNFVVSTHANLGAPANITITGGTSGQVLKTDGSGNLSWVTAAGSESTVTSVNTFTGDGTTVDFTLSVTPASINQTIVNYNGAMQLRSAYTLSGNVITFSEAPANGAVFEVTTQMGVTNGASGLVVRTYTGDGSNVAFSVSSGVDATNILVTDNGILQTPTTDYTVSSGTLTFTTAPANGSHIQIRELGTSIATITPAGSNTQVLFNDAGSFGNSASFTFDNTSNKLTVTHIQGEGGNISNIAVANINGIGNIATVNKDGNAGNILYGNGVFAAPPAAGTSNARNIINSYVFGS